MPPIQRNIGGNAASEGQGGPLKDVDPNLPNPNRRRGRFPKPWEKRAIEIQEQKNLALESVDVPVTEASLIGVYDNFLAVYESIDGNFDETRSTILKPYPLQKLYSDTGGVPNDDGETITHLSSTRRKIEKEVDGGTLTLYEIITPPYVVGELLGIAVIDSTDKYSVSKIDLNIAARKWKNEEPLVKRFLIKEIKKDYFNCYAYVNNEAVITDDYIKVAKPDQLRGSYWGSLSWLDGGGNIISYADASGDTDWASRVATTTGPADPENQIVIPPWLETNTIIKADRMDNGTGVAGVLWQAEAGAFAFSKLYEAP